MRDLYEPRNSKYSYENSDVLINYLDIHNTKDLLYYEAKITAAKSLGLRQKGITGAFDKKHYLSIHQYLFEDIYDFAGLVRDVNIAISREDEAVFISSRKALSGSYFHFGRNYFLSYT